VLKPAGSPLRLPVQQLGDVRLRKEVEQSHRRVDGSGEIISLLIFDHEVDLPEKVGR